MSDLTVTLSSPDRSFARRDIAYTPPIARDAMHERCSTEAIASASGITASFVDD